MSRPSDHDAEVIQLARRHGFVDRIAPGSFAVEGKTSTEESIAREWAANNHYDWRFDHGTKRWYRWTGTRWGEDRKREAFQSIREHARAVAHAEGTNQKVQPTVAKAAFVKGSETFCQSDPALAVGHDVWDADVFALGTPSGIIDLRTGANIGCDRSLMITRETAVAPEDGEPTLFLRFMRELTNGDDDLAHFLKLALGYCLTGSTREHALFFGYGAGKNGKSVLLNTVTRIMGDYSTTAAMDTFTASKGDKHPTDLARLDGARLVAASETEEGRAWAEARIKQLTGGDRIAARFMRQDFFEFTPRFKLFIVGNFRPRLHSVDGATRRRFNIIPFLHVPANPDRELEDKLTAEHGRILAWLIEGAKEWNATGLTRPEAIINATDRYFDEQDLIGQWIAERCHTDPRATGKAGELYQSWCEFAAENGEEKGAQKAFAEAVSKRGFERDRLYQLGRIYRGIDLYKNRHMMGPS